MKSISKNVRFCLFWMCLCITPGVLHADPQDISGEEELKSASENYDDLEKRVRSTLMFGGSSPVSFMGEARLKIADHRFSEYPLYIRNDRTWTSANWEGNESIFRLGMVVRPNRNTVLWSRIGFQHTLPGIYLNDASKNAARARDGFEPVQFRHDKNNIAANIHEDMCAGLAVRSKAASFWLKMGNVLWVQASPLTIWKSQPRTFAWEYLPFEIEQPIARYYEYNVVKGEKTGRAAWNRKSFNGIQLESIDLPWNLYANLMYATLERFDNFEPEYTDWSNDLAYADLANSAKSQGIGDSYRHAWHGRFVKQGLMGRFDIGMNYFGIRWRPDVIYNGMFQKPFPVETLDSARFLLYQDIFGSDLPPDITLASIDTVNTRALRSFYKEPDIFSLDLEGRVNDRLHIKADVALGLLDSVYSAIWYSGTRNTLSQGTKAKSIKPAFYSKIRSEYGIPVEADLAWISQGFYSPYSFAAPYDAFFPFGSNLVGSGKFISRGEASPYLQNMAGINITANPDMGYGHLKVSYGQHVQLKPARDLLFFPHRLNGQDLNSVFNSTYVRWGNGLLDGAWPNPATGSPGGLYYKRLGDRYDAFGSGGMVSDYLTIYEGFMAFESAAQADSNFSQSSPGFYGQSRWVPMHKKWSFNLGIDASYDISPLVRYSRDCFLSGYISLNGVSTEFKPAAFSQKEMLLWSLYMRLEPAISITDKLFLLGLLGYENWRSDMAYMKVDSNGIQGRGPARNVPLDFRDLAWGLGFDWDFAPRVGFHCRLKWMRHEDAAFTENNYKNRMMSGEIKMWF